MAQVGARNVATNDLGIMGGAVALFIFSFIPWFGVHGYGGGGKAWDVGFLAWFGVLLGIAAGILVVLRVFANVQLPTLQVGWNLIVLGLAGLSFLFILLKMIIGYKVGVLGFHVKLDRKAGLFLGLIASAVQTYFAFAAFKLSGEALPGGRRL
jgi:hypothetical protein